MAGPHGKIEYGATSFQTSNFSCTFKLKELDSVHEKFGS